MGPSQSLPDLVSGVHQGSILGLLLYIIFTNDLPEVVHEHLAANNSFYNIHCNSCGSICSFADDSTYSKSSKDTIKLKEDIDEKFQNITNYMARNKLVLNTDKTHLLVMTSAQLHKKHGKFGITLNTGQEVIEPVDHEKLLGCHISSDFKFTNHIRDNEQSMMNILTSRINALRKISFISTFKTRKMLAEGIVMSNILYIITVYGSCSGFLKSALQIIQNSAARCVTGLRWHAPVRVLLMQCGWLSINQLILYHSLVQVFKIRQERKPVYLADKLAKNFNYRTRLAASNGIRMTEKLDSDMRKDSFIPRTSIEWNQLPVTLRNIKEINTFKEDLRSWIKSNINLV